MHISGADVAHMLFIITLFWVLVDQRLRERLLHTRSLLDEDLLLLWLVNGVSVSPIKNLDLTIEWIHLFVKDGTDFNGFLFLLLAALSVLHRNMEHVIATLFDVLVVVHRVESLHDIDVAFWVD